MRPFLPPLLCILQGIPAAAALASEPDPTLSPQRMLEHARVLASDAFEGRAPGTPGEDKTVAYLASRFEAMGLRPGGADGTYFQPVPLVGITSRTELAFEVGGRRLAPHIGTEAIGLSRSPGPEVRLEGSEVVFVGYGISAPEFGWDDFKGADLRGKTVLVLINDPPVVAPGTGALDPTVFGGEAMTYYGRWTYKYDEISARGAAACLILHETGPAGYPFAVIAANSGREAFDLASQGPVAHRVSVEGWLSREFAQSLLESCGKDLRTLKAEAARRDFRPVTLPLKASARVSNQVRSVASRNVVAILPGEDPVLRDECVVFTAHWDGFGVNPAATGDRILNGAADNAVAVAMLLDIARGMSDLPPEQRPKRSVVFLSPTAEEKGLLGSRYYVAHPLFPPRRTVANINLEPLDANQAYGPTRDLEVVGPNRSTLDDWALGIAAASGRVLRPDSESGKGYYYRSDHFEFAKAGVPAFFVRSGLDMEGFPPGHGAALRRAYLENDYHKVTDEVKPDWTLEGAARDAAFLMALGLRAAREPAPPVWRDGAEFKARRETSLSGGDGS